MDEVLTDYELKQLTQLANAFATDKAASWALQMRTDSGVNDILKKHLKHLEERNEGGLSQKELERFLLLKEKDFHKEFEKQVGKWIALAFVMGYKDGAGAVRLTKMFV